MPRLLPPSLHLPSAAAIAVGAFVAPWALAIAGWSVSTLDAAPLVAEVEPVRAAVVWIPPPPPPPAVPEVEPEAPPSDEPVEDSDGTDDGDAVAAVEPAIDPEEGGGIDAEPTTDDAAEQVAGRGSGQKGRAERRRARRRRALRARCREPHPRIRTRSDGTVEIDRSLVHHYTHNLDEFLSLGVSGPYKDKDDGLRGWLIEGFGCTNPVYKAGFRKGDVLLTVNGKKTRTWPQIVFLYQTLKRKDRFDFEVVRRGRPVSVSVVVVEDHDA